MKFLFLALLLAGCPSARESVGSVVQLHSADGVHCSGVVISETEIATARHCVDEGIVEVDDMTWISTREHYAVDLAIVEFESTNGLPIAEIARYSPDIGDELVLVGYGRDCGGYGERRLITAGYTNAGQLHTHGEVCAGDSGGGVFNNDGELVGIHSGHTAVFSDEVDIVYLEDLR